MYNPMNAYTRNLIECITATKALRLDKIGKCFSVPRRIHSFLFLKWNESDKSYRRRLLAYIRPSRDTGEYEVK